MKKINFTKEEIIEMLRILWRGISKMPTKTQKNKIWKKIENKLTKELYDVSTKTKKDLRL